ncbi:IS110 family transposase [Chloroflexi bacterium TSY]|nr:IS110 family transposase [Chloroflexi bacterium TSY]
MNNPLLVGVDVHRKQNVFSVMDESGNEIGARFRADNNRPGTAQTIEQLRGQMESGDYDGLQIGAEATGYYWLHFFQTLQADEFLNQWPLELYSFNPRVISHYKKTFVDLDKTDGNDAYVIADRLRLGRELPVPFNLDEQYLALRCLTRYRYHLVHNLAREKSYFLAILYLKASEYTRKETKPFSDVFGAASRAVLLEFASIEEIAALPFDQLQEFIDEKGKRRFPDPSENTRKLQRVAQDSYPLPQPILPSVNLILSTSLRQITHLERAITRIETAIEEQVQAIPHTLDSIPGLGPVYTSGIIAEIGDIARFDFNQAKVAKFAGFKWRRTQSADFDAEETRLTRTGNRYLRYYFCEAANIIRLHDADYKLFYQRKFKEVRKHQHKRAIVLTARKLIRLVVRLLTTNQTFQPRRATPD